MGADEAPVGVEAVHPRGLVRLLQRGEPAVLHHARRPHARQPGRGEAHPPHRGQPPPAPDRRRGRGARPRHARRLQVLRLLRGGDQQPAGRPSGSACRCRSPRSRCRSASASSSSRRSPTSSTCTGATASPSRPARSTSACTSASSRTSSPARSCAPASSSRSSPSRATRATSPSAPASRSSSSGSSRRSRSPTTSRGRSSTPCSACRRRSRARRPARLLRLRRADLLRLLRLHGHRDRPRAAHGLRLPAELRPPVPRADVPRVLAALAHDALALLARLPLHPARRQPRRQAQDRAQPHAHDGPRRPVARRRLGLRAVGLHPRLGARHRERLPRADEVVAALVGEVGRSRSTSSCSRGSPSARPT